MVNQELVEIHEQKASDQIDRIDGLAKHMVALADVVGKDCELLAQLDWETFVVCVEQACGDLFYRERNRLMEICGDKPEPESMIKPMSKYGKQLFESLKEI